MGVFPASSCKTWAWHSSGEHQQPRTFPFNSPISFRSSSFFMISARKRSMTFFLHLCSRIVWRFSHLEPSCLKCSLSIFRPTYTPPALIHSYTFSTVLRLMMFGTDGFILFVSAIGLSRDILDFINVDFTIDPSELRLRVSGPFGWGEKMTDVCGKQDVVIVFVVDVTNDEVVVTTSVTWTSIFEDAILNWEEAFELTNYFGASYDNATSLTSWRRAPHSMRVRREWLTILAPHTIMPRHK